MKSRQRTRQRTHIAKRLLLALSVVLVLASPVWAQVAIDGEAIVQQTFNGAGPFTWTGKTTAGTNRCGIFATAIGSDAISGVTWDGVAMTLVGTQISGVESRVATIWRIINPPTGASNIVMTLSAGSSGYGGVTSYNNCHQTTPVRASGGATGTASPATVTVSSAANDLVVDAVQYEGSGTPPAVGAGQTSRWTGDQGGWFGAGSTEAGAASVTMSWTLTTPTDWAIFAASLQPAAAASGGDQGLLLGVLPGDEP